MRSYVEYSLPSKTIPAGTCIVERVSDRDVSKLDFPKDATGFYFFDSKILAEDPYDAQDDQRNCSEQYIIAEKIITAEEARALKPPKKFPPRKPLAQTVKKGESIFNHLKEGELENMFWESSLNRHRYFAVMQTGKLKPVNEDNIVVNRQKEQLYPIPEKPFSPALEQGLRVTKPLRLKTPPPKSP